MRLILDTNVVIDWLVFDDPYMTPLREQVADGRAIVLTHAMAIAEFERVLGYPMLKLDDGRRVRVATAYRALTSLAQVPSGFARDAWQLPANFPGCRDADDDLFLALAHHTGAMLVSRDKAVLKMRKRVRKFGVSICTVQELIERLSGAAAASHPLSD